MKIKPGVSIKQMSPQILIADMAAQEFCRTFCYDCVITGGCEPGHSTTGLHHSGMAHDYRTRDMTDLHKKYFEQHMRHCLQKEFDVVMEKDHLHVEYDPKH
jgi:hypothetical protein